MKAGTAIVKPLTLKLENRWPAKPKPKAAVAKVGGLQLRIG